jgi:DNA-binding NarL/FixJ family response regulator
LSAANKSTITTRPPVIVCDDHIAIRIGLEGILKEHGFVIAGSCHLVDELLALVKRFPSAVVITDLAVEGLPIQELIGKIHENSSKCQVLVYSMRESSTTISMCYKAGAIAFVPKSADPDDIAKAVEHAMKGQRYFPPAVAAELANLNIDKDSPSNILTKKELPIFIEYCKCGDTNMVAEMLDMQERTVQNILSGIAKKLDTPRRQLHLVARKYGLIEF